MLQKSTIVSVLYGALIGALVVTTCNFLIASHNKTVAERENPYHLPPLEAPPPPINTPLASSEPLVTPTPTSTIAHALNGTPTTPDETATTHTPQTPLLLFVREIKPYNDDIRIEFSSVDKTLLELDKNLLITPAVPNLRLSQSFLSHYVYLHGDFRGNTEYTITIKAGTQTASGAVLKTEVSRNITTPPLSPALQILAVKGQMMLTEETSLPCQYSACNSITVNVWKAFPNNLIHYGQTTWHDQLLEHYASHTFTVPYDNKNKRHALLPLYDLVNGTPGVYRFVLTSMAKDHTIKDECYIILSNIGATYAYDKRLTPIVAVNSLVDGTPMEGAYVALYDDKNQLIAAGVSNEQGIAMTEEAPEAAMRKRPFTPTRMIVSMEDDVTIIECDYTTEHSAYKSEMEQLPTFPTTLWPDRDAIHPGEHVQLYGLVRDATMTAINELPLHLELYTPDNRLIQTENVISNRDGYFTADLTIPNGARDGYYTVKAKLNTETLDETDIYVSDFTPNHVKLSLDFPNGKIDQLNLTTKTYFGSSVTQGSGVYSIELSQSPLPKAWEKWTIGTGETSRKLVSNTFKKETDSKTMTLPGVDKSQILSTNAPIRLTATATFSEPNNRAVTATTFIDQTPHNAYLAMRYDHDSQTIQFKQYIPEGNPVAVGSIKKFILEEHHSKYNLVKTNRSWHYQWEEYTTPIDLTGGKSLFDASEVTLTSETISKSLMTLPPGNYTLTAQLNDTVSTRITFWHNLVWEGQKLSHPSNLTFTTDKRAYAPGEIAQLSFISPVDGRVVVTCGDTELQHAFAMDVTAGETTLPIPISETTKHGAWFTSVTLIAKNINTEARYFGVAKLTIDHRQQKLNVALDAPKVARPQENITLNLNVTTSTGEPCRGTVAVFAVDESVLDVTAFETPNPHKVLFSRTESAFTFGDIYGSILPQLRLLPDGRIGGDTRSRKRHTFDDSVDVTETTTVITMPLQEMDTTGQLSIPVTLPDFKGSIRFMVVVANETQVGATDATTIVRTPVTLTAAGVRYGCAGDQAETTLRIINHDLPAGPYTLTVGNKTFSGELAMGETIYHTLRLPVGSVTATFQMGDFTTSVTQKVAIQKEVPLHAEVQIKILPEGETLPEGAELLPSIKEVRNIALQWLKDYPYSCTEQLSSRLLPYTFSTDPNERAFVKRTFERLAARRTMDGGFSLWENIHMTHVVASLFASQVLIEGSQSGILSKEYLHSVVTFLNLIATSTDQSEREEAAYAAFLLGEAKASQHAIHAARNLLVTNKTDPAAYMAATTLALNGVADEGAPIMKAYLQANPTPQPLFKDYMNKTTAQAMTLYFAIRAGVISHEEIETRFADLTQRHWNTTQTCAWIARALSLCETLPICKRYRQVVPTNLLHENAPIKVTKQLVDRNGTPVTQLNHGDLAYVVITMQLPHPCYNLILRDRLPGGLEYEDANLATRESAQLPTWAMQNEHFGLQSFENTGAEIRFFGSANARGSVTQIYPVRATAKGSFAIPAAIIEDMYAPNYSGGHDPVETLIIQ